MITLDCNKWDARFLSLCDVIASWSEDESMKVGCVVVGDANEVRSVGYNGLPRNIDSSVDSRHSRVQGKKYLWYEHAERNAIYNATRVGVSLENCRIYITHFPCADCARGIVQSGICEVNTFSADMSHEKFAPHYLAAQEMFSEAGVLVRLFQRSDPLLAAPFVADIVPS